MASARNDALLARTVEGSLNYYDGHKVCGTAADRGLATRLSGHNYNILSNQERDEVHLRDMRHGDHYIDKQGHHTVHFFGARRRKFAPDDRNLVAVSLRHPGDQRREQAVAERRAQVQLSQLENAQSFGVFQERCGALFEPPGPRRYSIDNGKYAYESAPVGSRTSPKGQWLERRGESMVKSSSAPSLVLAEPAASLERAMRADARKEASQRQNESAHFAPWAAGHTYANSLDSTALGRRFAAEQRSLSVNRLENYDFAITRKNNHYSAQDKLTRTDPFFIAPRKNATNNSVKYDIVNNERRWFKY